MPLITLFVTPFITLDLEFLSFTKFLISVLFSPVSPATFSALLLFLSLLFPLVHVRSFVSIEKLQEINHSRSLFLSPLSLLSSNSKAARAGPFLAQWEGYEMSYIFIGPLSAFPPI